MATCCARSWRSCAAWPSMSRSTRLNYASRSRRKSLSGGSTRWPKIVFTIETRKHIESLRTSHTDLPSYSRFQLRTEFLKRTISTTRSRTNPMPVGTFTAVLHKEGELYVAECPEVGTVSQGKTIDEALANLREATELYLEEFPSVDHGRPLVTVFEARFA